MGYFFSAGCFISKETRLERIERLSGYDLPDDMELLYSYRGETFTGVEGQYLVYALSQTPECILESTKEGEPALISTTDTERILRDLESNNVPKEYYPSFDEPYAYVHGNEDTYIMYFPQSEQLKIWMWGH